MRHFLIRLCLLLLSSGIFSTSTVNYAYDVADADLVGQAFSFLRARATLAAMDWHEHMALRAALEWQVELGALDAVGEVPIDRYAAPEPVAPPAPKAAASAPAPRSPC